jgi:hypothetical protein
MNLKWIRKRVMAQNYEITPHASDELEDEDIRIGDLEEAILNGKILEQYADRGDPRGDSCLIVGDTVNGDPLHVVASRGKMGDMHIVTVYFPKPPEWIDERTRRKHG